MSKKVVFRVTLDDPRKSRTQALKIAATVSGVESVAIKGDNKDQLEIIGEGIDAVELAKLLKKKVGRADLMTKLLRKDIGHADLLSVGPAEEAKKEEKQAPENKNEAPMVPVVWGTYGYPYAHPHPVWEYRYDEPAGCSIL